MKISRKSIQWELSCSMQTDGHKWRSSPSLFTILQMHLKGNRHDRR